MFYLTYKLFLPFLICPIGFSEQLFSSVYGTWEVSVCKDFTNFMDVKVDLNVACGLYSYPQYIYQDSKLLVPVVYFAKQIKIVFGSFGQFGQFDFYPRPDRKDLNVQLLTLSKTQYD